MGGDESYIGAYAWVENLVPKTPEPDPSTGGFVHAPSMAHAATAAILRSAYLSHLTETTEKRYRYAFDLTSGRVRAARSLLDGVRAGQPIGALLGYRFERFLHEREIERLLEPFRKAYPLIARKGPFPPGGGPGEQDPPRNVVDGLALRVAWRKHLEEGGPNPIPGGTTPAEMPHVLAALADLDDAVDGVSDLLTAEGVYQVTRGNVAATSMSLDALASGVRPPDPEVARTPRGGVPVTHRVIWLANADVTAPSGASRASANPVLDAWVGELLGEQTKVTCWVGDARTAVTLAMLQLGHLDTLELARAAIDAPAELERRILAAVPGGAPVGTPIHYGPLDEPFDWQTERTFPELLEAARHVNALLAQTRPLAARDFAPLDGRAISADDPALELDLATRIIAAVNDVRRDLQEVINGEEADIRDQLEVAATYLPEAFPLATGGEELKTLARTVVAELEKRRARAQAVMDAPRTTPDDAVGAVSAALKVVFGESFLRLCPFTLSPTVRGEFTDLIARNTALLDNDNEAPVRFLQQLARVRRGPAAWRTMWMFVQATTRVASGGSSRLRPTYQVAQIPYVPGEGWGGTRFETDERRPAGSRLSLLLSGPGAGANELPTKLSGLVIDEWTEIVPNEKEQTGVAFHYDDPGAEAAQAILIAVAPDLAQTHWSFAHLVAAIQETFELAKIRAVEPVDLGEWGHVLPATYLSRSTNVEILADKADDVSTRFDGLLTAEPTIV